MHSGVRALTAAIACLALSGCEKPEIKACETFIKSTIQLPSSYKRLKISSYDKGPMSRAQFYAEAGLPDPAHDESPVIRRNAELVGNALGRRDVYIQYETDGAQATERCAFKLVDGEIPNWSNLDQLVERASMNANSQQLEDAGLLPHDGVRPKIGFRCCVSPVG